MQVALLAEFAVSPVEGKANPGENPGGNSLSQGDRDPFGSMAWKEDAKEYQKHKGTSTDAMGLLPVPSTDLQLDSGGFQW